MIVRQLDLQLPIQSVTITTEVLISNPADGEVYPSIQHYVLKKLICQFNTYLIFFLLGGSIPFVQI